MVLITKLKYVKKAIIVLMVQAVIWYTRDKMTVKQILYLNMILDLKHMF